MSASYVGDGVHVELDGCGAARLYTDRSGVTHEIFLEPRELLSLLRFLAKEDAGMRNAIRRATEETL
jgi:hypothetical protein